MLAYHLKYFLPEHQERREMATATIKTNKGPWTCSKGPPEAVASPSSRDLTTTNTEPNPSLDNSRALADYVKSAE